MLGIVALLGFGVATVRADVGSAQATQQWSHGNPSNDEQYMLELINRARANPPAEGRFLAATGVSDVEAAVAFFGVDLDLMIQDFDSYGAQPPLAYNAELATAALVHANDLVANEFQGHVGTDGSTLATRLDRAGYDYQSAAENVFSYAKSPFEAHAAFNIDWGANPPTGVQQWPEPGHRQAIMNFLPESVFPIAREVGISYISDNGSTTIGPNVVVQEFGRRPLVFATGVVFEDANGNNFYDPGEGVGGVKVEASNGSFFAVTSSSGGYAVPVTGLTGPTTLTFSGGPVVNPTSSVVALGGENVKADLLLTTAQTTPTTTTAPTTTAVPTTTAAPTTTAPPTTTSTTASAPTIPPTTMPPTSAPTTSTIPTSAPLISLPDGAESSTTTAVSTTAPVTTSAPPTTVAALVSAPTIPDTTAPTTATTTGVLGALQDPTAGSTTVSSTSTTAPNVTEGPTTTVVSVTIEVTVEDTDGSGSQPPPTVAGITTVPASPGDDQDAERDIRNENSISTTIQPIVVESGLAFTGQRSEQMMFLGLTLLAIGLNLVVSVRRPIW